MAGRPSATNPVHGKNSIRVEVTPEELQLIDAASDADGRWRGAWCRRVLVTMAKKLVAPEAGDADGRN